MNEVGRIAQKVIVFKDGKLIGIRDQDKVTQSELIQMMVGRELDKDLSGEYAGRTSGNVVLACEGLRTDKVGIRTPVSFQVHSGEIVGFAGLVGAGRTEIMQALYGIDKIRAGTVTLDGKPVLVKSPKEAIAQGIVMVSEDRKDQGVLPNISVKGNISVSVLKKICNNGVINFGAEEKMAEAAVKKFDIRTPDTTRLLLQLSGGNQQKAILARYLQCEPRVLILDEPTKGIDVGAKSEFHRIIFECAKSGMAVLVVSSELPELIPLCDRILVIRDGAVSGELQKAEFSEEAILKLAMPGEKN
jgi:ABC-type sugar transport system ATPase subunit